MSPFAGLRLLFVAGAVARWRRISSVADKRVALVIGNRPTERRQVTQSARDADAIDQLFKAAGFDTVYAPAKRGNCDFALRCPL